MHLFHSLVVSSRRLQSRGAWAAARQGCRALCAKPAVVPLDGQGGPHSSEHRGSQWDRRPAPPSSQGGPHSSEHRGSQWDRRPAPPSQHPQKWERSDTPARPIESGCLMPGGKHVDSTFEYVFDQEQNYCNWLVQFVMQEPSKMKQYLPFVIYVQHRWLDEHRSMQHGSSVADASEHGVHNPKGTRHVADPSVGCEADATAKASAPAAKPLEAPAPAEVWGLPDCLDSKLFVITGQSKSPTREQVKALIVFFGGAVRVAMSSKTHYLLVMGEKLEDWQTGQASRQVESSGSYRKAKELNTPILIGLRELLGLVQPPEQARQPAEGDAKLICFKFET